MPESEDYVLGIDIGVTNVKCAGVTRAGQIAFQTSIETVADRTDWPQGIKHLIEGIEHSRGPAASLGIAAPGIAAPDGTRIAWMQGRLDALEGLEWTKFLRRARPVPVLNDAQAALLGEAWLGAARGAHNAMLLTLGTGVGGALMVDGHLLRGHLGRAGHLGHVSLDPDGPPDITNCPGSLEHAIGNCTVGQRTAGRFTSTHDLIAACERGDPDAKAVWQRAVRCLAVAIASLINVADPEIVVIGGGIARAGRALFDPIEAELDRVEWRPHGHRTRIVAATLGEYAGALGAARNAMAQPTQADDVAPSVQSAYKVDAS
jgi:glucokinase